MKVTFPFTQPDGFQLESFGIMRNASRGEEPSYKNNIFFGKGALLFKFFNYFGPVQITINLEKLGRTGDLANAVIDVPKGRSQFVLFDAFPPSYIENYSRCYCEMWVASGPNLDDDATVKFEIFKREK